MAIIIATRRGIRCLLPSVDDCLDLRSSAGTARALDRRLWRNSVPIAGIRIVPGTRPAGYTSLIDVVELLTIIFVHFIANNVAKHRSNGHTDQCRLSTLPNRLTHNCPTCRTDARTSLTLGKLPTTDDRARIERNRTTAICFILRLLVFVFYPWNQRG